MSSFLEQSDLLDANDLTPKDEKRLQYLDSIHVDHCCPVDRYTITFRFKENPYFDSLVLRKAYRFYEDDNGYETIGTTIRWKEPVESESFFEWFEDSYKLRQPETTIMDGDSMGYFIRLELWNDPLKAYNHFLEEENKRAAKGKGLEEAGDTEGNEHKHEDMDEEDTDDDEDDAGDEGDMDEDDTGDEGDMDDDHEDDTDDEGDMDED